jgi:hypothetical protein
MREIVFIRYRGHEIKDTEGWVNTERTLSGNGQTLSGNAAGAETAAGSARGSRRRSRFAAAGTGAAGTVSAADSDLIGPLGSLRTHTETHRETEQSDTHTRTDAHEAATTHAHQAQTR